MSNIARVLLGVLFSAVIGTSVALASPPKDGSGGIDFGASLVPATVNGVTGRMVTLTNITNGVPGNGITGLNFEPGICNPYTATTAPNPFVVGKCLNFTNSATPAPGEFNRAHNGQTAFSICNPCTVDGKTGSFTLKITYPNPNSITFTHFTIQDAKGDLAGLKGEGTLNFANGDYTFQYHFN